MVSRALWVWCGIAACSSPKPPPAQVPVGTPVDAQAAPPTSSAPAACLDPVTDARARLGGSPTLVLEPVSHPSDLDGDGQPDVILRSPGGREATHLLYVVTAASCPRFVGQVEGLMIGCNGHRRASGLCELAVDTWLMHGDRLRSAWSFDGTAYRRIGDGELVPGPRKH